MVFDTLRKSLQSRLQSAADQGELLLERLATAEVDAAIHAWLRDFLVHIVVFIALLALAQWAGGAIEDRESRLLVTTTLILAIYGYGAWLVVAGLWAWREIAAVWLTTRQGPVGLARFYLYGRILQQLRETFTGPDGRNTAIGTLLLQALKLIDAPRAWDGVAYRLADRLAPRLAQHAFARVLSIFAPVAFAWLYYRFIVFPEIIRAGSGIGPWNALLYPFAALIDAMTGTSLRESLTG
jgi:hypothetical protein